MHCNRRFCFYYPRDGGKLLLIRSLRPTRLSLFAEFGGSRCFDTYWVINCELSSRMNVGPVLRTCSLFWGLKHGSRCRNKLKHGSGLHFSFRFPSRSCRPGQSAAAEKTLVDNLHSCCKMRGLQIIRSLDMSTDQRAAKLWHVTEPHF